MDLVKNKNQSDIINYRPNLKMDNVPSLNPTFGEGGDDSSVTVNPPTNEKSTCLSSFEENMPSNIVSSLENLINNAKAHKGYLFSQMANTQMGSKYINAKDEDTKMKIAKENENSLTGTTYLEAYLRVESIYNELLGIKEEYTKGTYGEHIGSSRAKEVDVADIDRISTLEREGDYENINYTSMFYETMISNIMNRYCFHMDDSALTDIGNFTEFKKPMPQNDKLNSLMSQNFHKKQEILQKDIFKDEKTAYNVRVALRNAFLSVQEYEDSLDAINSSFTEMNDEVLGLDIQRDLVNDLSESMQDLLSITTYSIMAKKDISSSLQNKSNIREYFVE